MIDIFFSSRLKIKRFQIIIIKVNVIFMDNFSKKLKKLSVKILYHSLNIQNNNGKSILKFFLGDGFVEVLFFVVFINNYFKDLINIKT